MPLNGRQQRKTETEQIHIGVIPAMCFDCQIFLPSVILRVLLFNLATAVLTSDRISLNTISPTRVLVIDCLMAEQPIFVQLAQLENQLLREKVTFPDYKRTKWEILQLLTKKRELVDPLYRGKRSREVKDSQNMYFCYVPPGVFLFGEQLGYGELNAGIYVGKYPVTVQEFKIFLQESGWAYPPEDLANLDQVSPERDCPVAHVSWADAKQYCRWLRAKTNEYYSLPYESEWEYAARGIDGRLYPWGIAPPTPEMACYQGSGSQSTVSVKRFPNNRSPFGCQGMAGNVWEWCLDEFDDPAEPHLLRGGAWCHEVGFVNCVSRVSVGPSANRVGYAGFRLMYLPGEMFEQYQDAMAASAGISTG